MFKFFRRVSTSLFPRPDRPWNGDATSNAPQVQIGKKRRHEEDEEDDHDSMPLASAPSTPGTPGTPQKEMSYGSVTKKQRVEMDVDESPATAGVSAATQGGGAVDAEKLEETQSEAKVEESQPSLSSDDNPPLVPAIAEEESVKEVTDGVREVEISTQPLVNPVIETGPPKPVDAISPDASESTPSAAPAEAAAAVPLPASPVLEAQPSTFAAEGEIAELPASSAEDKEQAAAEETAGKNADDTINAAEDAHPIAP